MCVFLYLIKILYQNFLKISNLWDSNSHPRSEKSKSLVTRQKDVIISPRWDIALCHNRAVVFKLDSRTITCNLISEFNSYPTIFSNWHFIDIFIYSFWLSGVRKRNARQSLLYLPISVPGTENHRASGPLCDRYTFVFGTVGYKWKP